jgi:imidazolonepropionase-like amidohydrolase
VIRGAHVVGIGNIDVLVREGRIAALGAEATAQAGFFAVDHTGMFLAPAFVDSHVHLSYAFDAQTLAAGGVAMAVDLAAPIESLAMSTAPLRLLGAGPMITAVDGYPTQTWGAGGFGLEVDGVADVRAAVDAVIAAGAGVIKVPIGDAPELDDTELRALVERAHARGRKVVAHALADADAMRAASADVDVLAHTPVEALSDATVQAWSGRAVISTLDAFGAQPTTIENLKRLREAGCTVLYGTDLGNTGIPAIDHNEIDALRAAGLSGADILAIGTAIPASFWGFTGGGVIEVGARASFIVVEADPREDPQTLTEPVAVYIDGEAQPPSWTAGGGIKND